MGNCRIPGKRPTRLKHTDNPRWVILVGEPGVITLPDNESTTSNIDGGRLGLLTDTNTAHLTEDGHSGIFIGPTESNVLQIPTQNNEMVKC